MGDLGEDRNAAKTDFGFRKVRRDEKAGLVQGLFDSVADRYDLMNDLMSLGVHRLWKQAMLDWLAPRAAMRIIDVAGGTGDIAFRVLDRAPGARVTVADLSPRMVAVGRDRAIDHGYLDNIDWICASAESLPFPDQCFDAYTVAYGIRNVTDIAQTLSEARRVLKPGGRFLCLEFSHVTWPLLDKLYDAYSFSVLPWLGGMVAGERDAYAYLAESIRKFPDQKTFAAIIKAAGFDLVKVRDLSGGIAALHSAWRV
jgi:demethylmenaquinone methyltransferase/2-methoxy-6-polyprenyl-1,4-benzoquinol methylase